MALGDDATATLRLLERCPDAITWAERVGYPTVHRAEHRIVPSGRAPMISGKVHAQGEPPRLVTGKAIVSVTVGHMTDDDRTVTVDAVVDTGATTFLTLPPETVRTLDFHYVGERPAELATGEVTMTDTYAARVLWDGEMRTAVVHEASGEPLLGMALLWGNRLCLDAQPDGDVTIDKIQP